MWTQRLGELAAAVEKGEQPEASVRELLRWFDAARRGANVVWRIRKELREHELTTVPDFTDAWIDAPIRFESTKKRAPTPRSSTPKVAVAPAESRTSTRHHDGLYRIGRLPSANKPVAFVTPGTPLARAVTKMLTQGYSQLPIMKEGARECSQAITWRSLAERLVLGKPPTSVDDCAVSVKTLDDDTGLIDAISDVVARGFVLVRSRSKENRISGIVTTADLSEQYQAISEPFLLIGQVENLLRKLCDEIVGADEIPGATPGGRTLGDYVKYFETPVNWAKLKLGHHLDGPEFVASLKTVKALRNEVMHFNNVDPLDAKQIGQLRAFAEFLELATLR